jgi:hypothetical protein
MTEKAFFLLIMRQKVAKYILYFLYMKYTEPRFQAMLIIAETRAVLQ